MNAQKLLREIILAMAASAMVCMAVSVATATPPVLTNLMVQLDGTNLGSSGSPVSTWIDQANDGSNTPGTYQNFVQGTASRQPAVAVPTMPNGTTPNVVTFTRGAVTTNVSSTSSSDYLRSVSGGSNTGTTAGADSAYDSLAGLTYFTVFEFASVTSDGTSNPNQQIMNVFSANYKYDASTPLQSAYATTTFPDGYDGDGTALSPSGTPDLTSSVRNNPDDAVGGQDQIGRGVPDIAANKWYIAATSWDVASGNTRIVFYDQSLGKVLDKSFTLAIAPAAGTLPTHVQSLLGEFGSNANAPGNTTGQALDGSMAELLFYASALNTTDMDSVLSYLNNKYFVSPTLAGDYNGDGKVNAADYTLWRKSPASFGGDPAGYNTWRSNFGAREAAPGAGWVPRLFQSRRHSHSSLGLSRFVSWLVVAIVVVGELSWLELLR